MAMWLKQSTAVTVKLGPFVDATDGVTAETGLTISQADIRLSKNGGDIAQTNNVAGATHDELGYYDVPLDTTDTNTLGRLKVAVSESGALPVWAEFMVVPANVWDSLFGSDKLQVHADEITAGLITATAIAADALTAAKIAADVTTELQSGLATAAALSTVESKIDTLDTVADAILADTGTDGVVLANDAITAAKIAADAIGSSELAASAISEIQSGLSTLDAAGVRSAVGLASANLDTQLGTIDDLLDTEVAAIKAKTDNLPADPADASHIAALIDALPTANENADALLDRASAVDGYTVRQLLRLVGASLVGEVSGAATATVVFRAADDSKVRITATTTSDGDRSAVVLDAT